jgi:hypothetical protein
MRVCMPISHDAAGRSFTNKIVSVLSASAADAQELSINALAAEAVSRCPPPIDWRPNLLRRESSNARDRTEIWFCGYGRSARSHLAVLQCGKSR